MKIRNGGRMKKQIITLSLTVLLLCGGVIYGYSQDVAGMGKTNLRSANMYMGQKNYEKAQSFFEKVLEDYPDNINALRDLGGIYFQIEGDYQKSFDLYTRALEAIEAVYDEYHELESSDPKAAKKFKKKYIVKAKLEDTKELILKLRSSCWVKLYNVALTSYKEDKTQEALDQFKALLAIAPDSVKTISMLANTYAKMGDTENEMKYLILSYEKTPQDYKLVNRIAGTHFEQENYQDAIAWYLKAEQLKPQSIDPLFNIAVAYSKLKNDEKAYEYFIKVKDLEPGNADNYKNASVYADKLGKTTEALELLKQAIELDPDDTANLQYLCVNLMRQEKYEDVLTYAVKWYNADTTSKAAVQLIVAAASKLNDEPLRKKYTGILQKMN